MPRIMERNEALLMVDVTGRAAKAFQRLYAASKSVPDKAFYAKMEDDLRKVEHIACTVSDIPKD